MATNHSSDRSRSGNSKSSGNAVTYRSQPEHGPAANDSCSTSGISEEASCHFSEQVANARQCIGDHSGAAVMASLVAGLGIGLLVGRTLARPARPKPRSYRMVAEGIGRRFLDRMEGMIPETLAEHFGK